MKKVYLCCLFPLSFLFINCDVDELKTELVFQAPLDEELLSFPEQNGIYYEIPGRVGVEDEVVVISEPSGRSIKIFQEGALKRVVRSERFYEHSDAHEPWNLPADVSEVFLKELDIPGSIATTTADSFYVLNYTPGLSKDEQGVYSFLHIGFDGKMRGVVNNKEASGFPNINWMDVDEGNRLWVSYEDETEMLLQAYENGKLIHQFSETQCAKSLFGKLKKPPNEEHSCEVLYPFSHGGSILFVGKIEEVQKDKDDLDEPQYTFKERIFSHYDIKSKISKQIFTHQSDPQESPYLTYGEESFILWVTEDYHHFRLEVYNVEGEQEKNFEINLTGSSHSWRSTYTTLRGNIHSIRVSNRLLSIHKWY